MKDPLIVHGLLVGILSAGLLTSNALDGYYCSSFSDDSWGCPDHTGTVSACIETGCYYIHWDETVSLCRPLAGHTCNYGQGSIVSGTEYYPNCEAGSPYYASIPCSCPMTPTGTGYGVDNGGQDCTKG